MRDGKIAAVGYHPPFDLLFSSSEFEYGDLVVLACHYANTLAPVQAPVIVLSPPNSVLRRGHGDR